MQKKIFPIPVYLEWLDACSSDSVWMNRTDIIEWSKKRDSIVRSLGFLVAENNDYFVIASDKGENENFSNINKIPKSWIKKMIDLRKTKISI